MSPARWCPTHEQLMILEEIYKNGLKTPNAAQIQQIAAHLSLYGKIEGKNVFYWFQNHKARDRQKLRRKLYKHLQLQHQLASQSMKLRRFDDLHLPSFGVHQQQPLLPLEKELEEASTAKLMDFNGWRVEIPGRMEMEKCATGTYGQDWTTENGDQTTRRSGPPRTLELFPITGSDLKDDSGSGKGVYCCSSGYN